MIGCGLLSGSLLILVSLDVVWLRVGEERTERRSVLLKGRETLEDEVEGWAGREVEAAVEAIDFTAAAPATDRFGLVFLVLVLRSTRRLVELDCTGAEQLWSWGKR